jgi:RND family efflux transporter MFP subunit
MAEKKRGRWWWIVLGVLILAAGLVRAGLSLAEKGRTEAAAPGSAAAKRPVAVTVEPVTLRSVQRTVKVVGTLFGRDEVTIYPKVDGRIIKMHHDIGDVVRPGETLIELDPTDYILAVNEARRALELELAKLGLKEFPDKGFNINEMPSIVRAEAQERLARTKRERLRLLGSAATAEDRDMLDRDVIIAQAEHRQSHLDAEATLASVRQKQAILDTAQQRLRDTRIVAPACQEPTEYVVSKREVPQGEIVYGVAGMSTALLRLVVDRPLKLRAMIPERHRGEIKVGLDAEVTVEAFPAERFAGRVARVNPAVDRGSRTFQVEIHVPNNDRRLSPGGFAKVSIQTRLDGAARTVPEEAIVSYAGVTRVFVVRNDQVQGVPVRTMTTFDSSAGSQKQTWVEVEGDLAKGDLVATSGQTQLADGTVIRVRESETPHQERAKR